jgi:hypothetical protein
MYRKHDPLDRVYQGDILQDLSVISSEYLDGEENIISIDLPYAVVMTQDCDLQWDYATRKNIINHDKYLPTILICPAYLAESLRAGTHLNELGQTMHKWNSDKFKDIKKQNNDRFHFLESNSNMQIAELVVDFKHYYTISRDVFYHVYHEKYLASLNQLYREYLSQRFVNYLCRIGLPDLSNCEPDEVDKPTK